jgi:translation initiation factor 2B subunit (eIF-2B alpha/beta/delta family)
LRYKEQGVAIYQYPNKIQEVFEDIEYVRIHSATTIAKSIIEILIDAQIYFKMEDSLKQKAILNTFFERLHNIRPSCAPLINIAFFFQAIVNSNPNERLTSIISERAKELKKFIDASFNQVINNFLNVNKIESESLFTMCYSSYAISVIKQIHYSNKNILVFVAETRPLEKGRKTAIVLSEAGIKVVLAADGMIPDMVKKSGAVIVGADAVLNNGALANKGGTLSACLAANHYHKPVYSVTSVMKFLNVSPKKYRIENRSDKELYRSYNYPFNRSMRITIYNPTIDITPSNLIAGYITDAGFKTSKSAGLVCKKVEKCFKSGRVPDLEDI